MKLVVNRVKSGVRQNFELPGDKSIAHRALIIGALPKGKYEIHNFPKNLDCLATLSSMNKLGVKAELVEDTVFVESPGYDNFYKNPGTLNAKNSGTTVRLMSGLLAGCGIRASFIGDESLSKRPMKRIIKPLEEMGAKIKSNSDLLPLEFESINKLKAIEYKMPVASAQVKSCVLIAGFLGEGKTTVEESIATRDHTERLFKYINASINKEDNLITIENSNIESKDIYVPGDISTAAFLIGAVMLSDDCEVILDNILLNKGRRSYLDILRDMGASIEVSIKEKRNEEEIGTIKVKSSKLNGVVVDRDKVPGIIDEIPLLSVLGAFAKGKTVFHGVEELKYKESNRIKAVMDNLQVCGIKSEYVDDNLIIYGEQSYLNKDITINPVKDHRIALSFLAMATRNNGKTVIEDFECTEISFPKAIKYFEFFYDMDIHK